MIVVYPLARIGESAQFVSASRPLANLRRIGVPSSCEVLGLLGTPKRNEMWPRYAFRLASSAPVELAPHFIPKIFSTFQRASVSL